jgi:hypothetical protein
VSSPSSSLSYYSVSDIARVLLLHLNRRESTYIGSLVFMKNKKVVFDIHVPIQFPLNQPPMGATCIAFVWVAKRGSHEVLP